jgi:hypothetical protein
VGITGTGNAGTGNSGTGGDLNFDGGLEDGGDTYGCSPDLKQVVDGAGTVLQTCPPDQGCSGGQCVAACQAAADSQGNVGCDFVVATPYFFAGYPPSYSNPILPPCFAVFLANNWDADVKITITRAGQTYDPTMVGGFGRIPDTNPGPASWPTVPTTGIPQTKVAVLFLSQDPASVNGTPLTCPVTPAINTSGGSAVAGSNVGSAWRIQTSHPVSAYDMLPFGGADSFLPSAELILPTSAWGTNYIAVNPPDSSGPPWGQLTASEDNTNVQILPNQALPAAGTVPAAPANVTTPFTLMAGQYVQWQAGADMTGTVIQADKPVVFTGGNAYVCYTSATSTGGGCDSAHQIIPPVSAFGSEYVAPPYVGRGGAPESIRYRIVAAVDGTVLSYDPAVPGAPVALNAKQLGDFETTLPFAVSSQDADHPFYLGQIMSGCFVPNNDGDGDEEWVNILPPAQFLSKYVFFTDPTYPSTNFALVRMSTPTGFSDVTIDCLGTIAAWTPVGAGGKYQVAAVDMVKDGVGINGCTNGPHVATSDGPFGIIVWGLDTYSSYAYPAGGNVAPINQVIVPPMPE